MHNYKHLFIIAIIFDHRMGLTPKQLELVQTSWDKVEPIADTAADIFYSRMFSVEPSYRELFPEDMAKQKKSLMMMLSAAVKGITNLDELVPKVQDLGRRHAKVRLNHSFVVLSYQRPKRNICILSTVSPLLVLQSYHSNVQNCELNTWCIRSHRLFTMQK